MKNSRKLLMTSLILKKFIVLATIYLRGLYSVRMYTLGC